MRLPLLLVASLVAAPLSAQGRYPTYDFGAFPPYRAAVPNPERLLGHPIGSRHTMYHEQRAVLDAMIAAAGDRVRTEENPAP